jgi:hypothetical protein
MIRLYVVVTQKLAESIRRQQAFPEFGKYYALLDDGEICRVPSPRFSDLSWHQVEDFEPDALPSNWEELSIEFPEQAIPTTSTLVRREETESGRSHRRLQRIF